MCVDWGLEQITFLKGKKNSMDQVTWQARNFQEKESKS